MMANWLGMTWCPGRRCLRVEGGREGRKERGNGEGETEGGRKVKGQIITVK